MSENIKTHQGFIIDALNHLTQEDNQVHGWTFTTKISESCQSLLLGNDTNGLDVYQDRTVTETSYAVNLFVVNDSKDKVGTAGGSIDPLSPITEQIQALRNNASLALNPYFDLPDKPDSAYPSVASADEDILNNIQQAHAELIDRINTHSQTLQNVIVNSAELFTNKHEEQFLTSKGIRVEKQSTDLYFEVAMEKAPAPNEQEVLKYWHFVGLKDANVESCLDAVASETALTTNAQLPRTQSSAVLLINSYAISKMMAAIVQRLNGHSEFSKGPHFKANDVIHSGDLDERSDSLTLSIDPLTPLMAKSSPFTDEGLPAQQGCVIDNNKVLAQLIDSRIAQYLKKPANHLYGNMIVETGQTDKNALLNEFESVIEVLDFSSLRVNPASLTWSSEIKLGLQHSKTKSPVVLKGGIVSGNLAESFSAFKFSSETSRRNATGGYFESASGYVGPEYMLTWKGISIAGQEETSA